MPFASPTDAKALYEQVAAGPGRSPDRPPVLFSAAHTVCVGRDEAELTRRAAATGQPVERLRQHAFAGTPDEVVDKIGQYAAAGASRIHLQLLDLSDLDQIDLIGSAVASQL